MPLYGKAGESLQYVMSEAKAAMHSGLVLMKDWRPSESHVATAAGTWEVPVAVRVREIDAQLRQLDQLSVRPLRAIYNNTATEEDHSILNDLEAQALALRTERESLQPK